MVATARTYARTPAPGNPARTEAWALLEAARQMAAAKDKGRDEILAAVRKNWRLWTIFQASLVDAECPLPAPVRGNLLGLANFIDRHVAQILADPDPKHLDVLIRINSQIGEGLLEGMRAASAANAQPASRAALPAAESPGPLRESA
jgi:flagellar biosynthesis activator protein FlaF